MQAPPPPAPQENPFTPPGVQFLAFEQFNGINTASTRPGVKDEQMAWSRGFMPLGPQYLRTLYGVGTILYTAPAGTSIVKFEFGNIGAVPYCMAFLSNGRFDAINVNTSIATQVGASGTITTPSAGIGMSQWGSQYLLIVANQTDGYWVWDGTLLYGPSTLGPVVTMTNNGTGYTTATAAVSGGSGSGATFTVQVSGGIVTGVTITNPGTGYAAGDVVTLTISGTHTIQATGTVTLMPRSIGGTAVETYSGHVWIAKGAVITYSAPGSVQDFSAANGGGNFTSSDSYLRVAYYQLVATNGFLYLIGDSSMNYISGVSTTAGVTTFTNQNADPESGTIWPDSVDVFGRNIVFANAFGAHISYGAAVTKISEPLDGVYNSVPVASFGITPSGAKAEIFGKKVWMLLLPIIDPITQIQTNELMMWNGKIWWSAVQDVPLTFIQHQEINSVLNAWGTNGSSIYPLFNTPSTGFSKVVQSKLWAAGGIFTDKTSGRLWVLGQYYRVGNPNLVVSIDNEFGIDTTNVYTLTPATVVWTTPPLTMTWTTQGGTTMTWFIPGINSFGPQAVGQHGVLIGETMTTFCDDMALIATAIDAETVTYRG